MSGAPEAKSKGGFALGDYVEVKDRIRLFYEAYPSGAIVTEAAWVSMDDDIYRVWVKALAYRAPDDPHPGVGHSWMALPGTTPYTRGSELENTETSAWGRAIAATGLALDKGIASGDEVRNKQSTSEPQAPQRPELERRAEGLVGTITRGASPVDLELRTEVEPGPTFGFKLKSGKNGYQAIAVGPLAESLAIAQGVEDMEGVTATVWGKIEMVPFVKKDGFESAYARIAIERVQTPGWTLPGGDPDTVPMFDEVTG